MITRKMLVSAGLVLGALGAGAAASAAVGDLGRDSAGQAGLAAEPTTTQSITGDTTTTTEEATTTADTTTTTEEATTTTAEAPTTTIDGAPFGLCNAFSGRARPGKSHAWQELHDQAAGDIEAICKQVLADHGRDKQPHDQSAGPQHSKDDDAGSADESDD